MRISTNSRVAMERSICDCLGVTMEELFTVLTTAIKVSRNGIYYDEEQFNHMINIFVNSRLHIHSIEIDGIPFFHLTRRLNGLQNIYTGINIVKLLTTQNAMSDFLKDHQVKFVLNNGRLDVHHKGSLVSLENNYDDLVPYLRSRLGHNKGYEDFCFNGFLLGDLLLRNDYAVWLNEGPEFLTKLSGFLERHDILIDYYKNSDYYCFEYCVPLSKVLFDGLEELTHDEKVKWLLNRVLNRLCIYIDSENSSMDDEDNQCIRLTDYDVMEAKYFIRSEKITEEMLKQWRGE